ncbi:hypothetical protein [Butyrivibrio fibrisolvens]|uniref:hypothetical protein n=1 Tax=Butyrivibrio fibrisolvens TaxID=831 RepID=UPI0003F53E5B|nr:hypothetical protein [Butyrivibrio fibrisolvens]
MKKILAYKPLLARIFKEVIEECKNFSYEEIEKCIEGDVIISKIYVDNGLSNNTELIGGQNTEDYENEEGLIKYDIRTYLKIPHLDRSESIKILIDVEAQNEDNPGYDIINTTIINISENHDVSSIDNNTVKLLTTLFDETLDAKTKISELQNKYGLPLTKELEMEVTEMCTYATSMENKGIEKGLRALVNSLKVYIKDFDSLYEAIIKNEDYANVSKEQVRKYY